MTPERSAGEQFVLLSRVTNWRLAAVAGAGVVLALTRHPRSVGGTAAAVTATVLAATALSTVRLVVEPGGVTIGMGPWGWPSYRIPAQRITGAHVEQPKLFAYGGWGLRWHPRNVRIIVRRAPSLVLTLTTGRTIGVTTPQAPQAAALLSPGLAP